MLQKVRILPTKTDFDLVQSRLLRYPYPCVSHFYCVVADGKISRMEMSDDSAEDTLNESIATLNNTLESLRSLSRLGQDQGYDINSKLRYIAYI